MGCLRRRRGGNAAGGTWGGRGAAAARGEWYKGAATGAGSGSRQLPVIVRGLQQHCWACCVHTAVRMPSLMRVCLLCVHVFVCLCTPAVLLRTAAQPGMVPGLSLLHL